MAETESADVVRVDFGGCLVQRVDGSLARARVRARLMGPRKALGNAVVVGDRVTIEPVDRDESGGDVVITEVAPRRNAFRRRAVGRQPAEQVVAANLGQIVHVAASRDPSFSAGLADRVLCQAEQDGIPARLVLNKVDLEGSDTWESAGILADYERAGYPGHAVSARTGRGIVELLAALRGTRSLFVGHSGVGKSTLLNAMVPGLELQEGRVNPKTGRGRHTTTAAWLLRIGDDLEMVDTPGMRAFGLWGVGPGDLDRTYPEFRPWLGRCRFADCAHTGEPGCAVRGAVENGDIARRRYASFLKVRAELAEESAGSSPRPSPRS